MISSINSVLDKMQKFVDTHDINFEVALNAPSTWQELKDCDPNNLIIYSGHSDKSIWGISGNHLFRAVHDYIHITHGLDFSDTSEIRVRQITCDLLQLNKNESRVLEIEIDEQIKYKNKYGKFPDNQITFFEGVWND